ncbi:ER membrane protein complex subunit 4 [Halotydeus destructor]|nr:ER membrane protein complex subunit 4 [Halotydeus destructor]
MASSTSQQNKSLSSNIKDKRHKWALSFGSKSRGERHGDLPSPPGYTAAVSQAHSEASREADPSLVVKKSWDIALAPLKQIPMNLFIMYMAGNSISIFPIMMVGMLFLRPLQALFKVQQTFKIIEGGQHLLQKLIYLVGNVLCIGVALYKCNSMGLLPTHPSDWLDFLDDPQRLEFSGGGISF